MGLINLNCPGCGSPITLDETREYGFCTYCGNKVMVDKTIIEHKGSVKIDNEEYVQHSLQNARRALKKQDWDEVEKYYNLVEQNVPNSIEAVYYSAYGKTMSSLFSTDYGKRKLAFDVLSKSISVISDYYETTTENKESALKDILSSLRVMCSSDFIFDTSKMGGQVGAKAWTKDLIVSIINAFLTELQQIKQAHHESFIDPMIQETEKLANSMRGGCYVATCVYGSYDCPQVWTLRRYRDDTLASTWYGRAFIRTYYAISPTLVKWFGKTKWFKKMWQGKLDRMVKKLNEKGVQNTPYQDKDW